MTKKSDSKWLSLATASILGQPPSTDGGGQYPIDPCDTHKTRTLASLFVSVHLPLCKGGEQSEGAEGDLSNKISPNPSFPKRGTERLRLFQYDLALTQQHSLADDASSSLLYGARVYVRFNHQPEPLAFQVWRRLRQLFLSRLNV